MVPVLVRGLAPAGEKIASLSGRLYAANTAGAIAGTLLAPFALIPAFGVRGAAFVGGGLNLIAAAGYAFVVEGLFMPRLIGGTKPSGHKAPPT